jgi:hypothetical protein
VAFVPRSVWALPTTVVADTTGEGAALASDSLDGMGSIIELAGTTFEGSALASVSSDRVGTASIYGGEVTGEGSGLPSVRSVVVGPGSHCRGGHER